MKAIFILQIIIAVVFVFFAGFISCKSNTEPEDNNGGIVYPDSGLSFSQHIRPIFLNDCASTGTCHQSAIRAGGLDLESDPPDFISSYGQVVIPFRSDQSILYQVLFGPVANVSNRMPPPDFSVAGLRDNEIKAIGTWIDEGAITAN
jgi:hypothetical protein